MAEPAPAGESTRPGRGRDKPDAAMPYTPGFQWDHTSGYGASLGALEALGTEKGYTLVHTELAGVK